MQRTTKENPVLVLQDVDLWKSNGGMEITMKAQECVLRMFVILNACVDKSEVLDLDT